MTLAPVFLDYWVWWLAAACLWVEIARRLLAATESHAKRKMPLIAVVIVGLLWPVIATVAAVATFRKLPRTWKEGDPPALEDEDPKP